MAGQPRLWAERCCAGGSMGVRGLPLGGPVAGRAGQAGRGGVPPAWGALPSAGRNLPAATQKTAGTCPGPRSLQCYSCRSPGSDLRAWAACPAGGQKRKPWGRQLILLGTRAPQEPSLPRPLTLIPLGGSPGTACLWGTISGVLKCPERGSCSPRGSGIPAGQHNLRT